MIVFDVQMFENQMVFFNSLLGKEDGELVGVEVGDVVGDVDGCVEGGLEGEVEVSNVGFEPQSSQEHL